MNPRPVQRASQLSTAGPQIQWLVEGLWSDQAVGILGGEPKCYKSFLALDRAVSVASGPACLRPFAVRRTGKGLLFPAEDSLAIVRQRLEGIATMAPVDFPSLPVEVIPAPSLRLDPATDRQRLADTVQKLQPILLVLDPLIRLHRIDENDATPVAARLSDLRELQRRLGRAILLVHHARKDSTGRRPGQARRGSRELHGWGDSHLSLRRQGAQLTLSTEHRAAASQDPIPLQLTPTGSAVALAVLERPLPQPKTEPTAIERVRAAWAQLQEPVFSVQQLRKLCALRTETRCAALEELTQQGELSRNSKGDQLNLSFPVSRPRDPQGNGNGQHTLCSSGGEGSPGMEPERRLEPCQQQRPGELHRRFARFFLDPPLLEQGKQRKIPGGLGGSVPQGWNVCGPFPRLTRTDLPKSSWRRSKCGQ
jgi:hypothetical protein